MPITDTSAFTPFFPEDSENELTGLILELTAAVGKLSASMHPVTASAVAELVITVNSYYSNLIGQVGNTVSNSTSQQEAIGLVLQRVNEAIRRGFERADLLLALVTSGCG